MSNIFVVRNSQRLPDSVLEDVEAEYNRAHTLLDGYETPAFVQLREQIGEAIRRVQTERRSRRSLQARIPRIESPAAS